ncbi:Hsp70 family protein [Adhaeretor mobilis]|uniref:Chaperone protein HscC n=1 Tax=Adhaeretor mobilis TaxID=1930276 RepID=A0A517MPE2_9BACT|nr:Hsp70 family protein [Adhaeretor mobilis]QDS96753.1 Chaperone protein HscC [Adhaeretor mobilis]
MILGIDLGTTNSLCAVFEESGPRLVKNSLGEVLTPSVVAVLDNDVKEPGAEKNPSGQVVVGAAARELRVTQPERCASCFKRLMGSKEKVSIAGQEFTAPELSSFVLRSLKADAENDLGEEITEAVITVPAYFNEQQRRATKLAGELAGLKVRRIINEPTAAALTYGFHDRHGEKYLLVVDLGGGTFDVTLMEVFEGTIEIVSTAGESFLGGEDFTDRLMAEVLQHHGKQLELAELQEPLLVARLRQLCETAKRQLASQQEVSIRVPDAAGELTEDAVQVSVTREEYAEIVKPLMKRIAGPIGKALRDGDCQPEGIDEVILVGGATRMPVVREFLQQYLEQEPLVKYNPDEVVCLGAAVQAALMADDRAVEDLVMTDVCPHTLGVNTVKQLGTQTKEGYYTPIIHRNTTIPTSREERFSTVQPNQTHVVVEVYQGEQRRVENNLKLGELAVKGIPPGPAGQEIFIRFSYDVSGLIEVEAYAAGREEKFRTVLTTEAGELTESEIAEAIERMQGLKYYPREDMQNQRLLRLGERLMGEVSPFHREELEVAIDHLEASMNSGDREQVEAAQEHLRMVFSTLGLSEEDESSGDDEGAST